MFAPACGDRHHNNNDTCIGERSGVMQVTTIKKATNNLGRLAIAASTVMMLGLAPASHADETVALKNALYGAGYDIGNVSSKMDDATRSALTEFQKENGLQASGMLDEDTKKALGMISIQVAANSTVASQGTNASAAAAEPAQTEAAADDAIEEDDEGGWSLW